MTDETKPYELTRNPVDETWGFICREHGVHRHGLTHQHAVNTERKHLREDHADPLALEVNLTEAARLFLSCQSDATRDLWAAMTGLDDEGGYALAIALAKAEQPIRAAVVPF